ncbi:hypothetical protein BUALT_Bualt03G0086100 [Buddleja alternifolia]|uniref:Cystatin domain-containing protein n=1 Tax=Buddleja alternifolia TaxID=168488 RepID=A0AAV6XYX0_9LAMI|nr:hypothetical protein BUALT_Bualt03G0086100 [Buddleja alternifolia]
MPHKLNIFLITIEFFLVTYILLDVYAAIFGGVFNIGYPDDRIIGLNATNEDPKVVGLGHFAVDEYNRLSNSNLKFQNVVKALFAQSSYMLLIQVENRDSTSSESKQYAAIVKEEGGTGRSLIVFEEYMESAMWWS